MFYNHCKNQSVFADSDGDQLVGLDMEIHLMLWTLALRQVHFSELALGQCTGSSF